MCEIDDDDDDDDAGVMMMMLLMDDADDDDCEQLLGKVCLTRIIGRINDISRLSRGEKNGSRATSISVEGRKAWQRFFSTEWIIVAQSYQTKQWHIIARKR